MPIPLLTGAVAAGMRLVVVPFTWPTSTLAVPEKCGGSEEQGKP